MTEQAMKGPDEGVVILAGNSEAVAVPSGQPVTLQDVIQSEAAHGPALRFRFVAPQIARQGEAIDFDVAANDMADLCQSYAMPRLAGLGVTAQQIIISLSAQAVPFGEAAPEVTQYFEAYRVENGTCIWEMF